ncbi:NAD-dependent epimerase/dehydratase family protein [Novosphingobium tardum]|uniref:NAD-dependent epimerase/dehydratase family protein n=1 Tax=Novosphingobium tardum TaxID=1538021 RepID=A0ABV8RP10_9SPHN
MARHLVAITGATGFVGQALLERAGEAGLDVRALTRRPQERRERVDWIAGDLADSHALGRLVEGAEAVIHVAGVVNAPDAAGFEEGNVAGTLNVVEAAVAAGVPRLVHVSSLSAREPQLSDYGNSKLRAEKVVMASPVDWTIVRPPAIYGPRDREMLELFKIARRGFVPLPPKGRMSAIHVDDLARLLLALISPGEDVSHRVFEPDDGREGGWSHESFAKAIGWAVGRRISPLRMPAPVLRMAAHGDRLVRGAGAKLTADRVEYMCHPDWVVTADAAVPVQRWTPEIPTRDGLKKTAAWYREAGWL